jgi:hypothetical protein
MRVAGVLAAVFALAAVPLASGAPAGATSARPIAVRVYAFPSPDSYPHAHGATVPMRLVATATTSDRTFSVELQGLGGRTTNLVAVGLSGGAIVDQYFFSATHDGTYVRIFPAIAHVSTTTRAPELADPTAPDVEVCSTHFDRSLGTPWGVIGGTYSTTNGGVDTFDYQQSASSSVGIGVSATGAAGTFSASGSYSVSTTADTGFPTQWFSKGSFVYETNFTENEYYGFCYNPNTGQSSTTYFNKTDGWNGGAEYYSTPSIHAAYCKPYIGGSNFTKSTTSAWTFASGMTIPVIDFEASMQSGYSTTVSVNYSINQGVERNLCGVDSYPGGSSPLLLQAEAL